MTRLGRVAQVSDASLGHTFLITRHAARDLIKIGMIYLLSITSG